MNCRRLIDRLLMDICSHAGMNNGMLMATYDQLVEYGISRGDISATIHEAKILGLIKCKHGKKHRGEWEPNLYTLTWMGTRHRRATNEWKEVTL